MHCFFEHYSKANPLNTKKKLLHLFSLTSLRGPTENEEEAIEQGYTKRANQRR